MSFAARSILVNNGDLSCLFLTFFIALSIKDNGSSFSLVCFALACSCSSSFFEDFLKFSFIFFSSARICSSILEFRFFTFMVLVCSVGVSDDSKDFSFTVLSSRREAMLF